MFIPFSAVLSLQHLRNRRPEFWKLHLTYDENSPVDFIDSNGNPVHTEFAYSLTLDATLWEQSSESPLNPPGSLERVVAASDNATLDFLNTASSDIYSPYIPGWVHNWMTARYDGDLPVSVRLVVDSDNATPTTYRLYFKDPSGSAVIRYDWSFGLRTANVSVEDCLPQFDECPAIESKSVFTPDQKELPFDYSWTPYAPRACGYPLIGVWRNVEGLQGVGRSGTNDVHWTLTKIGPTDSGAAVGQTASTNGAVSPSGIDITALPLVAFLAAYSIRRRLARE